MIVKRLFVFIFLVLLVPQSGFGFNLCTDVYGYNVTSRSSIFKAAGALLRGEEDYRVENFHEVFVPLQTHPQKKEIIAELKRDYKVATRLQTDNIRGLLRNIQVFRVLLELSERGVKRWLDYFTNENHAVFMQNFNSHSVVGHMMQTLPKRVRLDLLEHLGGLYKNPYYKRKVTQPIHVLMNPKAELLLAREKGLSDYIFYSDYIARLQVLSFPLGTIQNYNASLVGKIVHTIQQYIINQNNISRIVFFGSIPNGMAQRRSDIDLFNFPDAAEHPRLIIRNSAGRDPLVDLRFAINDPILVAHLNNSLTGTIGRDWSLEAKENNLPHEHFPANANRHVFSIIVGKENIEVRFYSNLIRTTPEGKNLDPYEYEILEVF